MTISPSPQIDDLLHHLVDITSQRDHVLLDGAVIAALDALIGIQQARILEIFMLRKDTLVRPRTWIEAGSVISLEESAEADHSGELLSNYPILEDCLAQHKISAQQIAPDGSTVLLIPIWTSDKITTCVELKSNVPYSDATLRLIQGILHIYRNYQSLIDYSERDSLTGLYNRKTFDEKFSRMVTTTTLQNITQKPERRAPVNAKEQWLATIDIDHFKRINDTFGHLYGDEVLILVANLLRSSFRAQDKVFRFGGEEFVILLRAVTRENALNIFERFRNTIAQHHFPQIGQITISLGFASITQYETPVMILGHADQALYYAKTHGRNQVCQYDELEQKGLLHPNIAHDAVELFSDTSNAN